MKKGIGVIGCGSRMVAILGIVQRLEPRIGVVAICDPDPGAVARGLAQLAPQAAVCTTEAEQYSREDVDWVFVGSPNALHVRQAQAAMEAGKHVFCEKPLGTTIEDCAAMAKTVAAYPHLMFFFGLVLRYSPFYRRVKEILESGEIGEIISFEFNETLAYFHGGYIHGNWRRHRRIAGTHLLEKCCHDLDLANWFTGSVPVRAAGFAGCDFFKPSNRYLEDELGKHADGTPAYRRWRDGRGITPFSDDKDIADNQVAIMEYGSGVRASFHTNCNSGIPERRFYICGSRGALRGDALTSILEVGVAAPGAEIRKEDLACPGGHGGADEPMSKRIVDSMLNGALPSAGIREAVDSALAALLVDRATDQGRVVRFEELGWGNGALCV